MTQEELKTQENRQPTIPDIGTQVEAVIQAQENLDLGLPDNWLTVLKEVARLIGDFTGFMGSMGLGSVVRRVIFGTTYFEGKLREIARNGHSISIHAALPIDSIPGRGPIAVPLRLSGDELIKQFGLLASGQRHTLSISSIPAVCNSTAFANIPGLLDIQTAFNVTPEQLTALANSPVIIYIFKTPETVDIFNRVSGLLGTDSAVNIIDDPSLPYLQIVTTVSLWFANGDTYKKCVFVAQDETELAVKSILQRRVSASQKNPYTAKIPPGYLDVEIPVQYPGQVGISQTDERIKSIQVQFGFLGIIPAEVRSIQEAMFRFDTLKHFFSVVLGFAVERSIATEVQHIQDSLRELLIHDQGNLLTFLRGIAHWVTKIFTTTKSKVLGLVPDSSKLHRIAYSDNPTEARELLSTSPDLSQALLKLFDDLQTARTESLDRAAEMVENVDGYLNAVVRAEPRLQETPLQEILDTAIAYASFLTRDAIEDHNLEINLILDPNLEKTIANTQVYEFAYITLSIIVNAIKNAQEAAVKHRRGYPPEGLNIDVIVSRNPHRLNLGKKLESAELDRSRRYIQGTGIYVGIHDNGWGMSPTTLNTLRYHISRGRSSQVASLPSVKENRGEHGVALVRAALVFDAQKVAAASLLLIPPLFAIRAYNKRGKGQRGFCLDFFIPETHRDEP